MHFLIEYDRNRGKIVTFKVFKDLEKQQAEKCRLELELSLNRLGIEREIVVLEAASEVAIRRTHRRYFEGLADLVRLP